jgi:hypothetical protein
VSVGEEKAGALWGCLGPFAGFREALSGFDFKRGIEILIAENWLKSGNDGKSLTQVKVANKNTRFYSRHSTRD